MIKQLALQAMEKVYELNVDVRNDLNAELISVLRVPWKQEFSFLSIIWKQSTHSLEIFTFDITFLSHF